MSIGLMFNIVQGCTLSKVAQYLLQDTLKQVCFVKDNQLIAALERYYDQSNFMKWQRLKHYLASSDKLLS